MTSLADPLAVAPDIAGRLLDGSAELLERPAPRIGGPAALQKLLGPAANSGWHRVQLERHGADRPTLDSLPAWAAAADYMVRDAAQALIAHPRRRKRIARAPAPVAGTPGVAPPVASAADGALAAPPPATAATTAGASEAPLPAGERPAG